MSPPVFAAHLTNKSISRRVAFNSGVSLLKQILLIDQSPGMLFLTLYHKAQLAKLCGRSALRTCVPFASPHTSFPLRRRFPMPHPTDRSERPNAGAFVHFYLNKLFFLIYFYEHGAFVLQK